MIDRSACPFQRADRVQGRLGSSKRLIAWVACAVCACLPTQALAAARVDDAAATQAYLRAREAYARGAYAEAGASVAAMEARRNQIAAECPYALTYAPRDEAFEELGEEANRTLLYAGLAPLRSAALRLVQALGHVTWSNRTLTQLVRAEAAEEGAHATLALPDVCTDITAWKASAYAELPQNTQGFLARLESIESESTIGPSFEESREAEIMRLLRHYEAHGQRGTAVRVDRLLARTSRLLTAAAVVAQAKLAAGLGVSTL